MTTLSPPRALGIRLQELLEREQVALHTPRGLTRRIKFNPSRRSCLKVVFGFFLFGFIISSWYLLAREVPGIVRFIARFLPIPVVVYKNDIITSMGIEQRMAALDHFYRGMGLLNRASYASLRPQIVARLERDAQVATLAAQKKIVVSDEELVQAQSQLEASSDGQSSLEADLRKDYGWSRRDFRETILLPLVRETRLAGDFVSPTELEAALEQTRKQQFLFSLLR